MEGVNIKLPEFKLKIKNSDFCVNEIFLIPDQSTPRRASFTYLLVEKESLGTFWLLEKIATALGVQIEDVSASGLKDEQAKTRQIISVKKIILSRQISGINKKLQQLHRKIKVCSLIGYGKKPVLPRMVHGNEFRLKIRNLECTIAEKIENLLGENKFQTFINYYDEQRFGVPESIHNSHLIGKNLLEKKWKGVFNEYLKSQNEEEETGKIKSVAQKTGSYREAMLLVAERKRNFFISSYNSYLWNQALSRKIGKLNGGLKVKFPYIGELFFLLKDNVAFPPFFTSRSYDFNWQNNQKITKVKTRPANITAAVFLLNRGEDEIFKGREVITLSFILPTGCYATMLVKQLLLKVSNQVKK